MTAAFGQELCVRKVFKVQGYECRARARGIRVGIRLEGIRKEYGGAAARKSESKLNESESDRSDSRCGPVRCPSARLDGVRLLHDVYRSNHADDAIGAQQCIQCGSHLDRSRVRSRFDREVRDVAVLGGSRFVRVLDRETCGADHDGVPVFNGGHVGRFDRVARFDRVGGTRRGVEWWHAPGRGWNNVDRAGGGGGGCCTLRLRGWGRTDAGCSSARLAENVLRGRLQIVKRGVDGRLGVCGGRCGGRCVGAPLSPGSRRVLVRPRRPRRPRQPGWQRADAGVGRASSTCAIRGHGRGCIGGAVGHDSGRGQVDPNRGAQRWGVHSLLLDRVGRAVPG
eukprot:m.381317 g.381317  ORF g.381317 m.381317 type:complete len:338 (-) comp28246_c0_seq5:3599-4612(-)